MVKQLEVEPTVQSKLDEIVERLKAPDFDITKYDPNNELRNRFQRFFKDRVG